MLCDADQQRIDGRAQPGQALQQDRRAQPEDHRQREAEQHLAGGHGACDGSVERSSHSAEAIPLGDGSR